MNEENKKEYEIVIGIDGKIIMSVFGHNKEDAINQVVGKELEELLNSSDDISIVTSIDGVWRI